MTKMRSFTNARASALDVVNGFSTNSGTPKRSASRIDCACIDAGVAMIAPSMDAGGSIDAPARNANSRRRGSGSTTETSHRSAMRSRRMFAPHRPQPISRMRLRTGALSRHQRFADPQLVRGFALADPAGDAVVLHHLVGEDVAGRVARLHESAPQELVVGNEVPHDDAAAVLHVRAMQSRGRGHGLELVQHAMRALVELASLARVARRRGAEMLP